MTYIRLGRILDMVLSIPGHILKKIKEQIDGSV